MDTNTTTTELEKLIAIRDYLAREVQEDEKAVLEALGPETRDDREVTDYLMAIADANRVRLVYADVKLQAYREAHRE